MFNAISTGENVIYACICLPVTLSKNAIIGISDEKSNNNNNNNYNEIQPNPSNERLEKKREMKESIITHQNGNKARERERWKKIDKCNEMKKEKKTLTQFARME